MIGEASPDGHTPCRATSVRDALTRNDAFRRGRKERSRAVGFANGMLEEPDSEPFACELSASFAEGAALEVDVSDRVGEVHYTAVIPAVDEAEAVPEFMYRFLFASVKEQTLVSRPSIELLLEPANGNNGCRVVELGFTEHERKRRHEQVYLCDSQQFCMLADSVCEQFLQEFCGIVLFPCDIIRAIQRNSDIADLAGKVQIVGERKREKLDN